LYQSFFKNGKTELFDEVPVEEGEPKKYVFSDVWKERKVVGDASLDKMFRTNEIAIRKGKQPTTVWVATNKDELVTHRKVKLGKTRVFLQPTVDVSLLIRRYFGKFINEYKERAGFTLCHGIGQDKERVWKRYSEILHEVGENGFDIDYSNYDGTIPRSAVDAFVELIRHAYGSESNTGDHLARVALIENIVSPLVLVGDMVVRKTVGNCSGSPLTDVFNSITNWYITLVTYQLGKLAFGVNASGDQIYKQGLRDFDMNVRAISYGDDLLCSVSPAALPFFDRLTFWGATRAMGMTVTSASKGGELIPSEPLNQLTFLKSEFVARKRYMAAPLPISVIHRELQWTHKTNVSDMDVLDQKVDAALRMMFHHGHDEYQKLRAQLRELGINKEDRFREWEAELRDLQEVVFVHGPKHEQLWPDVFRVRNKDEVEGVDWVASEPPECQDGEDGRE
jgi:hypothetical protein